MASNAPGSGAEFLWGKAPEHEIKSRSTFTGEQSKLFSQLSRMLMGRGNQGVGLSLAGLDEYIRNMSKAGPTAADTAYIEEGINKPLTKSFQEDVIPSIARKYNPSGFYSSERIRTEERAAKNLGDTMSQRATEYMAGRQAGKESNLLQALGTKNQLKLGAFQAEQSANLTPLQLLTQLLGIPQMENIGFAGQGTEGLMQGLMGAGGQAAGTAGGIMLAGALSDERLKDDIEEIPNALSKIRALKGVRWKWKDDAGAVPDMDTGLLAQDVEKQFPSLVKTMRGDGMKGVNYTGLIGPLVQAVKELADKVEAA